MAIPNRANDATEVLAECDEFGYDDGSDNILGDLTESGLRVSVDTQKNPLRSGTQREIYAYLRGSVTQTWQGALLNFNANNVAFVFGMDEDAAVITGAGTSGDPYRVTIDPDRFGEQAQRTYYAKGVREDGDIVRAEAGARIFAPSLEFTFAQGTPTELPFLLEIANTWTIDFWTP